MHEYYIDFLFANNFNKLEKKNQSSRFENTSMQSTQIYTNVEVLEYYKLQLYIFLVNHVNKLDLDKIEV